MTPEDPDGLLVEGLPTVSAQGLDTPGPRRSRIQKTIGHQGQGIEGEETTVRNQSHMP